jgi:hypothetical protein
MQIIDPSSLAKVTSANTVHSAADLNSLRDLAKTHAPLIARINANGNQGFELQLAQMRVQLNSAQLSASQLSHLSQLAGSNQQVYLQLSSSGAGILLQIFRQLLPTGNAHKLQLKQPAKLGALVRQTLGQLLGAQQASKALNSGKQISWPVVVDKQAAGLKISESRRNKSFYIGKDKYPHIQSGNAQLTISFSSQSVRLILEQQGKRYTIDHNELPVGQLAEHALAAKGRSTQDLPVLTGQVIGGQLFINEQSYPLPAALAKQLAISKEHLLLITPSQSEADSFNIFTQSKVSTKVSELQLSLAVQENALVTADNQPLASAAGPSAANQIKLAPGTDNQQQTSTISVQTPAIPEELLTRVNKELVKIRQQHSEIKPEIDGFPGQKFASLNIKDNLGDPLMGNTYHQLSDTLLQQLSGQLPSLNSSELKQQLKDFIQQSLKHSATKLPATDQAASTTSILSTLVSMLLAAKTLQHSSPNRQLAQVIAQLVTSFKQLTGDDKSEQKQQLNELKSLPKGQLSLLPSLVSLLNLLTKNKAEIAQKLLELSPAKREYYFAIPLELSTGQLVEIKLSREQHQDEQHQHRENRWQIMIKIPVAKQGNMLATVHWPEGKDTGHHMAIELAVDNQELLAQAQSSTSFLSQRLARLGINIHQLKTCLADIPASLNNASISRK